MDVVSQEDRRRTLSDRRYLVADRDWFDHDHAVPGAIPTKPGSATLPFFGVDAAVVDEKGKKSDRMSAAN